MKISLYIQNCIFIFFLAMLTQQALACSFLPDAFCKTVNDKVPENAILRGAFIETMDNGMIFKRSETLRGDENRDFIKIWDSQTFDCNGPHERKASNLGAINQEIVVSLELIDSINMAFDVIGDYRVPEGIYWETHSLIVNQDSVSGLIYGHSGFESSYITIGLDQFFDDILDNASCSTTFNNFLNPPSFKVYPTISTHSITIETKSQTSELSISLFTTAGSKVETIGFSNRVDISMLENGIFILAIENKKKVISHHKIIKM